MNFFEFGFFDELQKLAAYELRGATPEFSAAVRDRVQRLAGMHPNALPPSVRGVGTTRGDLIAGGQGIQIGNGVVRMPKDTPTGVSYTSTPIGEMSPEALKTAKALRIEAIKRHLDGAVADMSGRFARDGLSTGLTPDKRANP